MTLWNRLSWRNDGAFPFRSGRPGLAIQVEVTENAMPCSRFANIIWRRRRLAGGVRMSAQWKYQIRIYLDGDLAEAARFDPGSQKLKWLSSVLAKHSAN